MLKRCYIEAISSKVMIIIFLSIVSAFCDDIQQKTKTTSLTYFTSQKTSVGISGFPWSTFSISLRGWDGEKSGSEFQFKFRWRNDSADRFKEFNYDYSYSTGLNYAWFDRSEIEGIKNIFLVKGTGVGISIINDSTDLFFPKLISYLTVFFPVGVEHFCINDTPNFSYSIDARPYVAYNSVHYSDGSGRYYMKLGVDLNFYIRWYL